MGSAGAGWVRDLASSAARTFYRVERVGAGVPDGPVLLLANHPNALLDPSIIWLTADRGIRFLAKSTLFQRHILAPLVRRSGAIPVYRRQDTGVDTSRNAEMFTAVQRALAMGDAVCIFPEGKSHSTGRLERLRSGAARIALISASAGVRVAIVPVGLNFERKAVFRSRAWVYFGQAFDCMDLVESYRRDESAAVDALTERISQRLRSVMVEADPRSDADVVARVELLYRMARGADRDPRDRLERQRLIAAGIETLRREDPALYQRLYEKLRTYDVRLRRLGLRDADVERNVSVLTAVRFTLRETLYAAGLLPIAVLGFLLFWPPYRITGSLIERRGDELDLKATLKAIVGGVLHLAWIGLLIAVIWRIEGGPVAIGVGCLLPVLAVASLLAIERESAVVSTVRAYLAVRRLSGTARRQFLRRRDDLARCLDEVYERYLKPSGG